MSEEHNGIPGARDVREHIAFSMYNLLENPAWVSPDAKLYFVGIGAGGSTLIEYMSDNWTRFGHRVGGAAWVHPYVDQETLARDPKFKSFFEEKTRAWILSELPKGSCANTPDDASVRHKQEEVGHGWGDQDDDAYRLEVFCPTFSCGLDSFTECVFPSVCEDMLAFFREVAEGGAAYVNPEFEIVKMELRVPEEQPEATGTTVKNGDTNVNAWPSASTDQEDGAEEDFVEVDSKDEKVDVAGMQVSKDLLAKAGLN